MSDPPCALVLGHPGHELRAFHRLETRRPPVCVSTDGSGRDARSRLVSARAAAAIGPIFARWSDRALHRADPPLLDAAKPPESARHGGRRVRDAVHARAVRAAEHGLPIVAAPRRWAAT